VFIQHNNTANKTAVCNHGVFVMKIRGEDHSHTSPDTIFLPPAASAQQTVCCICKLWNDVLNVEFDLLQTKCSGGRMY